jgi:hypothetical protein
MISSAGQFSRMGTMKEYLLKRTDGEWFDVPSSRAAEAYRTSSFQSQRVDGFGDWRIISNGTEISFSYEDAGILVVFEHDIPTEVADQMAREILQNIERVSGQKGRIVPM